MTDRQVDPTTQQWGAMKTVPRNVLVVTQDQAAQLAELPEVTILALADIVALAREGPGPRQSREIGRVVE